MTERRKLERHHVSSSLEVYDLDSGQLLGRVVDLHAEGLMLLSETPIELDRTWALQVNLPMTLNGVSEFTLGAESRWKRERLAVSSSGPACSSPTCPMSRAGALKRWFPAADWVNDLANPLPYSEQAKRRLLCQLTIRTRKSNWWVRRPPASRMPLTTQLQSAARASRISNGLR